MERIVCVHYDGEILQNDDGSAKFSSSMRLKVVVFKNRPKFVELVERVKDAVGWNESDVVIELQGRYDVGHGHSHKLMLDVEGDIEWEAYVDTMKESQ
jgi:hypothetical protein